jgi:hypothetical protein
MAHIVFFGKAALVDGEGLCSDTDGKRLALRVRYYRDR